jgi:Matrixin
MKSLMVAALALAFAPAPAQAWDFDLTGERVFDQRLTVGARAALAYWGGLPRDCRGQPPRWYGFAYNPPRVGFRTVAVAGYGCTALVEQAWLSEATDREVCAIAAHEIGHMLGLEHDDAHGARDPQGVMASPPSVPKQCEPGAALPVFATKRKATRPADRRWCARHSKKCAAKYPALHAHVFAERHGETRSIDAHSISNVPLDVVAETVR